MTELYSVQVMQRWQKRAGRRLVAVMMTAFVSLSLCIVLCAKVDTASAGKLLYAVIALSTLGGWTAMLTFSFGYLPARAEMIHREGMLGEESAEITGVLTVEKSKWYIPHSIAFCRAAIAADGESHALQVNARLVKQLPPSGTRVRAIVQRRFITAYEVLK